MAEQAEPPSERTLEQDIPELKDYLHPGAKVLDVGCGYGTITLDVAAVVSPGEVVGIDPSEDRPDKAQEWAAEVAHSTNITFKVGDSHALDFSDNTFDLVYSHTVVHFFLDPVAALKEQARVTRPGGWVVVSGIREWVYSVRNPPCPNWDRYVEARRLYSEAIVKAFQSSGQRPVEYMQQQMGNNPTRMQYMDPHAGKKCAGWLVDAGLTDLKMRVKAERLQYQGSANMEPYTFWDFLPVDNPEKPIEHENALIARNMIAEGLVDSVTVERAKQEIEEWYSNPHAFFFNILVFGAGKKVG